MTCLLCTYLEFYSAYFVDEVNLPQPCAGLVLHISSFDTNFSRKINLRDFCLLTHGTGKSSLSCANTNV